MCCIDCWNQKCVSNPAKIFYVKGKQENRRRCTTLADFFPDPETGGLMMLNANFIIQLDLLKIIPMKFCSFCWKMILIHSDIY